MRDQKERKDEYLRGVLVKHLEKNPETKFGCLKCNGQVCMWSWNLEVGE